MIRPSFVPPPQIRRLRDVTRYRADLVGVRDAEKNQVEKLLDQAERGGQRHLRGVRPRDDGCPYRRGAQHEGAGVAGPYPDARQDQRPGRGVTGHFTDHHAFLLAKMLARVDAINAGIAELDQRIETMIAPFAAAAAARLDEIPGIGPMAAAIIIAEVGTDMSCFPTPGHLTLLGEVRTRVSESAGKKKGRNATGHGNPYLARVLDEAAIGAARTDSFLGERYRQIARRRSKSKAIVAVDRTILVIVWHLLSDPEARYADLGPGFYDGRVSASRKLGRHVRQLEALGYKVTLKPPPDQRLVRPHPAPLRSAGVLPRARPGTDLRIRSRTAA
jgi:transposase